MRQARKKLRRGTYILHADPHRSSPKAKLACCIFGTIITSHKMFTSPPSATADVVADSDRPCATGMKETTVARTHRVCVSAPHKRPLCSSSELKN